jgi:polysaccharide biosynthesis transport protein
VLKDALVPERQSSLDSAPNFPAQPALGERIDFVLSFLRRRYLIVLGCLMLALPLGGGYLYLAPPAYTASTTMMIETRNSQLLQQTLLGNSPPDAGWIDSQIGVLKSQNVAAYVAKQLRLADEPEIAGPALGLVERALARFTGKTIEPKSEAERVGNAIGAVMDQVDVRRVGQSYMLKIDVRSHNPEQATKIANAMVDAYIYDQLNAKYQANRRAGDWLQERLQTLREQAAAAERAVLEFKAKNNIVRAGGSLMNEKQLSEISGQFGTARVHASDLQARLDRVVAVRRSYQNDQPASAVDETVSEAMTNGIITGLRTKYLDLVNREADWATRYGKNHTAVVNLRNQIRDLRKSIRDELGRIEETLKSEFEIAKKRQDELEKSLAGLVSQTTETNQAQVALFSLESAAQSYRKLYDSFLQRHTESVQQQSFPITEARSLSPASVYKTGPRAGQVWIVTVLAGGMLGVGFGALREIMDRGFRTREQVRNVLATECLALIPRLPNRKPKNVLPRNRAALPRITGDWGVSRHIDVTSNMWNAIHDAPSSLCAEAIRSIKLNLDLSRGGGSQKIIGLTSCLPSEGKSTIAGAMAMLMAQNGGRVILVDCDLHNPSLSRALAPCARAGVLEVIDGTVSVDETVCVDRATGMAFLPAVNNALFANATEMLASDAAKSFFAALQMKYDYVVVDLAPLVAANDVRATSRFIGSYVLVIEWGSKIDAVQYALRNISGVQDNIVGAVLNKVNMTAIGRYDAHGARYHYGYGRRADH